MKVVHIARASALKKVSNIWVQFIGLLYVGWVSKAKKVVITLALWANGHQLTKQMKIVVNV